MNKQESPRNIYLARHGHREDFEGEPWGSGWERRSANGHDPALSPIGIAQARELGERLQGLGIRHVFASPFWRTLETAHTVAEVLDVDVKIEEGFCEWLNPQWFTEQPAYIPEEELRRRFPRVDYHYESRVRRTFPEVEETAHAWPPVEEAVRRILADFEGDLLFIGHGSSVQGMAKALGGPVNYVVPRLCALMHFRQNGSGWEMLLDGCTRHLSITEDTLRFA